MTSLHDGAHGSQLNIPPDADADQKIGKIIRPNLFGGGNQFGGGPPITSRFGSVQRSVEINRACVRTRRSRSSARTISPSGTDLRPLMPSREDTSATPRTYFADRPPKSSGCRVSSDKLPQSHPFGGPSCGGGSFWRLSVVRRQDRSRCGHSNRPTSRRQRRLASGYPPAWSQMPCVDRIGIRWITCRPIRPGAVKPVYAGISRTTSVNLPELIS